MASREGRFFHGYSNPIVTFALYIFWRAATCFRQAGAGQNIRRPARGSVERRWARIGARIPREAWAPKKCGCACGRIRGSTRDAKTGIGRGAKTERRRTICSDGQDKQADRREIAGRACGGRLKRKPHLSGKPARRLQGLPIRTRELGSRQNGRVVGKGRVDDPVHQAEVRGDKGPGASRKTSGVGGHRHNHAGRPGQSGASVVTSLQGRPQVSGPRALREAYCARGEIGKNASRNLSARLCSPTEKPPPHPHARTQPVAALAVLKAYGPDQARLARPHRPGQEPGLRRRHMRPPIGLKLLKKAPCPQSASAGSSSGWHRLSLHRDVLKRVLVLAALG